MAGVPEVATAADPSLGRDCSGKVTEKMRSWTRGRQELGVTTAGRLWSLTEMFPERLRSKAGTAFHLSLLVVHTVMCRFSRAALWVEATSFLPLPLPAVFQTEELPCSSGRSFQGPTGQGFREECRDSTLPSWKAPDCSCDT